MPAFRPRVRALVVGGVALAMVALASGGAIAGSNPPTLYACFNTSGAVAMATTPQCKLTGGGQLAYWSTQGVPGPTGPQGATGGTGPMGPTGPAGSLSTRYIEVAADGQTQTIAQSGGLSLYTFCLPPVPGAAVPYIGVLNGTAHAVRINGGTFDGDTLQAGDQVSAPTDSFVTIQVGGPDAALTVVYSAYSETGSCRILVAN